MNYKIQIEGAYGWFDLMESDGSTYQTSVFQSYSEAEEEAFFFVEGSGEEYRIVPINVLEDWSPYVD